MTIEKLDLKKHQGLDYGEGHHDGEMLKKSNELVDSAGLHGLARGHAVADSAAADTAEYLLFRADRACTLVAARVTPSADVTADGANYATFTVNHYVPDAASATATLTKDTSADDMDKWTATDLDGGTTMTLAAGDVLTLDVAKTGTGVQLPTLLLEIEVDPLV